MRYIKKNPSPPKIIAEWISVRESAGQSLTYSDFHHKKALNELLRAEQKHICCYCQQRISHFQGENKGGSHNEHFIPQKGPDGNPSLQMEYSNIFASCNYSKGLSKRQQYCGEAKGNKLIRSVLAEGTCSSYFKYNSLGEILPEGEYKNYDQFLSNEPSLTTLQTDILNVIRTLNLNCTFLVEERKKLQTKLIRVLANVPKPKVDAKIIDFEHISEHWLFVDMLLYYMRKKK